jgi:hypothetical protein
MSTDILEEHVASIFRAKELAKQETSFKAGDKQSWLLAWTILQP